MQMNTFADVFKQAELNAVLLGLREEEKNMIN